MQQIAEMRREGYRHQKIPRVIAAYAPSDEAFGLMRIWQTLGDEPLWETEIFRERPEAIAWLMRQVAERFGFQISLA